MNKSLNYCLCNACKATAKPLNYNAVKAAVCAYLECQKEVTTLEIKELLRQKGFFAVQNEVSKMVGLVAKELRLKTFTNHKFIIYYEKIR